MSNVTKTDKPEETPSEFKKSAAFAPALIRDYSSFDSYYEKAERFYKEAEEEFFKSNLADPELPKLAAAWEEASRTLIMTSAALFGHHNGKLENKEKALAALERCKRDSGIRADNLILHYDLIRKNENPDRDQLLKLWKGVNSSLRFHDRAYMTQTRYLKLYESDPDYMTPELRVEKAVSERAAKKMQMVPKGHIFLPARPFPPVRIPEGEPVPWLPDAYDAWKSLPVEDLIYDTKHDEFTVPEGYVSKDRRIDDKSVVWDWEHNLVTMKFVGDDPITWPFWKPKDTYDVLKEGDWCAEYYIRLYQQILEDLEPPGMREGD